MISSRLFSFIFNIGLAIEDSTIEKSGGSIVVNSSLGVGTTFMIRWNDTA